MADAPSKLVTVITKTAAIVGLAIAAMGTLSFLGGAVGAGALGSALALGAVSWAGFRSAQATTGLRTHDFSKNVGKGTSGLAKLGGLGFMLLGISTMIAAATGIAPELLPTTTLMETMGAGAVFGILGYSAYQSGLGADIARAEAKKTPPPAPAPEPARSKGISIGASVNLGQSADLAPAEENSAGREVKGPYTEAVLNREAQQAMNEQAR